MGDVTKFPARSTQTEVHKALSDSLSKAADLRSVVILMRTNDGEAVVALASSEDDAVFLNKTFDVLVTKGLSFEQEI